ncbi:MAG: tRNA 2-thiouridine(34) synthase MnmA [Deltaproteobacteria bacterium]|jgi:tRNA-specific 2-thiouridylase|nr:tRNA 2-thiouridine(34) synthase MnmA [Deltaproteobacteria bacterium]
MTTQHTSANFPPKNRERGVLCALSGGVDSSVAALLLKREGFDVLCATMKLLAGVLENEEGRRTCCSAKDILDAEKAAKKLDLDFMVFNFSLFFEKEVMERFADSYARGLTPNPCVLCNSRMKFRHLLDRADALNRDFLATGHYARVEFDGERHVLKKAADLEKDQSYVLYPLTQEELSRALFPLGNLTKTEVRKIAAGAGLENAGKPESQDICFVPDGDYGAFLEGFARSLPPPGDIVDVRGKILGKHKGLHRYTIGQRKGLGLPGPAPSYVVRIDPENNVLAVGGPGDLLSDAARVGDVNFVSIPGLEKPLRASVKIRYRQPETPCEVSPLPDGTLRAVFDVPQKAVTPGQAAVFYSSDRVLFGGTILRD